MKVLGETSTTITLTNIIGVNGDLVKVQGTSSELEIAINDGNSSDDNDNDEEWFYFKSDGKAAEDEDRTINGRVYIFDEFGRMLDLWVYASTATNSAYFAEDEGSRGRNWIYAYPATDYDDYDDDPYWFYLDKR